MCSSPARKHPARRPAEAALLIYDAGCPLCLKARDWIERNTLPGTIATLPCQSEELAAAAPGMTFEACMEAMQLVCPGGRIYAGPDAFRQLLPVLKGWRWLRFLLRAPGAKLALHLLYEQIARNRYALSGLLAGRSGHDWRKKDSCKPTHE